jgi:hypothetical protein
MLREGPFSLAVHGLLEYLGGVVFIVAPFLLKFDAGAATAASIVIGVALIFLAAATEGPVSLINQIPVPVHVLLDYVLVAVLIASPFMFGFSKETAPTAFFIGLGVIHLLSSIGTRYRGGRQGSAGARPTPRQAKPKAQPEPSAPAAAAPASDRQSSRREG